MLIQKRQRKKPGQTSENDFQEHFAMIASDLDPAIDISHLKSNNGFVDTTDEHSPSTSLRNPSKTPKSLSRKPTKISASTKPQPKKKDDDNGIANLLKDFTSMSQKLKNLKNEKKSVKLKLRKLCKELLKDTDAMFNEGINHNTVVHQLWEINTPVYPNMLDSVWDDTTRHFFLKEAALEGQISIGSSTETFFQTFVVGNVNFFLLEIENLKDLSQKLDSIIDFSSNIEYESLDLLKLAFFDFFKRTERAEAPPSRD
jgi:hypothetical protein